MAEEGDWVFVNRPKMPLDMTGEDESLQIRFLKPARHWTDALPIGNGRLGAMVWGNLTSERIQLNEDTLWTGVPGDYTDSDASSVLSKVRKLVDDGQYAEATSEAINLQGHPPDVYQPLGDICLEFLSNSNSCDGESYERFLDLDTATVLVKYSVSGVEYTREYFVSKAHQLIVVKMSSSKPGTLSFTAHLDSKLNHSSYVEGGTRIIMEGSCPGKRKPPKIYWNDNLNGIQFSAVLELRISDGAVTEILNNKKIQVDGSTWVIFLLAASSSFDGPFVRPSDSKRNPFSEALNTLNLVRNMSYGYLYSSHLNDYQKLFHRVSLHLSKSTRGTMSSQCNKNRCQVLHGVTDVLAKGVQAVAISTAERVKSFKDDEDPSLVTLLFQYGRYLLISCSRPGTQVSNLQGIWNMDIEPAWDCAPHLNINLQMNYWPSLSCNLKECQEPLFDYISYLAVNGSRTAKVNYETSGWVTHHVSDIWAKSSPDHGQAVWALWPMGGAWLTLHLWEHYTYTLDKEFLKDRAYPILEGCTNFLLDWLIEGSGGYLETNPSTSPEHNFIAPDGKTASVSYSTTMDMAIVREMFFAIVSAAKVLGRSEDGLIRRVENAQTRLYPAKIARDGSLMEWAKDFEDPDIHHRHLSHLFGLFPGHTITYERTPDLCKAAANSLYKRGEDGPGWSTAWKIACWARLHDSEHAYQMVKHLFNLVDPDHESDFEGGLYKNLFTAHPPFQIDANFGFSAGIAEMLVQSTETDLYLLPAIPRSKWMNGCAKGLKARGGITVNICWSDGNLYETDIWTSNREHLVSLHYNDMIEVARLHVGKVHTFNKQLKCVRMCSVSEMFFL